MNPTMLIVFLSSLAGFTALFFWMWNLKVRIERLVAVQYEEREG